MEILKELQKLGNLALNILLAEKFYNTKVIKRNSHPNNKRDYYNVVLGGKERRLPNLLSSKRLLQDILEMGFEVNIVKVGTLFQTSINGKTAIDTYERSITLALLLCLLEKYET